MQKYLLERSVDEICENLCRSERMIYNLLAEGINEYKKAFH